MFSNHGRIVLVAASVLIVALLFDVLVHAAPPAGHFTVNADGTVTDNSTGLVWQRAVPSTSYNHADAIDYCAGLSLTGSPDWRLPTIGELQTIVDETRIAPAIDLSVFPSTPYERFWSSSPYAGAVSRAWAVHFHSGGANHYDVTDAVWVRCVR